MCHFVIDFNWKARRTWLPSCSLADETKLFLFYLRKQTEFAGAATGTLLNTGIIMVGSNKSVFINLIRRLTIEGAHTLHLQVFNPLKEMYRMAEVSAELISGSQPVNYYWWNGKNVSVKLKEQVKNEVHIVTFDQAPIALSHSHSLIYSHTHTFLCLQHNGSPPREQL